MRCQHFGPASLPASRQRHTANTAGLSRSRARSPDTGPRASVRHSSDRSSAHCRETGTRRRNTGTVSRSAHSPPAGTGPDRCKPNRPEPRGAIHRAHSTSARSRHRQRPQCRPPDINRRSRTSLRVLCLRPVSPVCAGRPIRPHFVRLSALIEALGTTVWLVRRHRRVGSPRKLLILIQLTLSVHRNTLTCGRLNRRIERVEG